MSEPTPITDRETYTVKECDIGFKVTPVSCAKRLELGSLRAQAELDKAERTLASAEQLALAMRKGFNQTAIELVEMQKKATRNATTAMQHLNDGLALRVKLNRSEAILAARRTALLALSSRIRREGMQGVANEIEEICK